MHNLIERYIEKLSIDDINNFAISKDITLSKEELEFTYTFIKKNYKTFLNNPNIFDINRYKENYSKENFSKISKVYQEYYQKYASFL